MSTMAGRSMTDRMRGAALLDVPTYEEVEHDTGAMGQAAGVVALVAVASGIGSIGRGSVGILFGVVWAFVTWAIWSGVTYFIGTALFRGKATWGEVLRTVGFAQSPGIFLVLGIIPFVGRLVRLVVAIWMLVTVIVALRQALDVTTGKAVLTALIGWIVIMIPMWIAAGVGMALR
jgi:hypothetical protein